MRSATEARIDDASLATLTPIEASSLAGMAYERIRALLLSGEVPSGTRLSQKELADRLKVSRTPVREALRRLAGEGLIDAVARGFRAGEVGVEGVTQRLELRLLLEPGIARLAAERAHEGDIAGLREAIRRQRDAADCDQAHDASRAFHLALARAAHNSELIDMVDSSWIVEVGRRLTRERLHADWKEADLCDHEAIMAAVEAADRATAERLMREHILATLAGMSRSAVSHGAIARSEDRACAAEISSIAERGTYAHAEPAR